MDAVSYLPTVWLASCLIRLNCFFILCFSALPAGGRASPHISSMWRIKVRCARWSTAAEEGQSLNLHLLKHPRFELEMSLYFEPMPVSVLHVAPPLQRCWTDSFHSSSPTNTDSSHPTRRPLPRCTVGNVVLLMSDVGQFQKNKDVFFPPHNI